MIKIGINGFGRIGRTFFRAALKDKEFFEKFELVAVNDLTDPRTLAHLLKYDSVHGILDAEIGYKQNSLIVNDMEIKVISQPDPAQLPWSELGVEIVLESTGRFRDRESAEKHLKAGAKKVVISAPAKNPDVTIIPGINQEIYDKDNHRIISMASCTTNCLAPITDIIRENFGIAKAVMTTIHSYTADQNLVDGPHKDLRRARAAALNIIPTTTGAAKATAITIPSLKNKFDGLSVRVPTPVGSICDVVFITKRKATEKKINFVLKKAARSARLKNIISASEEPLVSSDIVGNPDSAIVDLSCTKVIDGDTLVLETGQLLRLIGIDTPELRRKTPVSFPANP